MLNVAVFFGGESVEHEVSVISAHQAMEALDKTKYNVIPIYIAKDRRIYAGDVLWDMENYKDLNSLTAKATQVVLVKEENRVLVRPVKPSFFGFKELTSVDLAIPVMHGTNGEDGTIQGYFEMLKLPYAGCDLYGAAVGQDKVLQKHILNDNGLPLTDWFWTYVSKWEENPETVIEKAGQLGYPVILKPSRTGSSVGIAIAHNDEEYRTCFEDAARYDEKVITEKVVKPMVEINCSVLGMPGKGRPSVLEQVQSISHDELLNFADKYQGGGKGTKGSGSKGMASASRLIPAPLEEETTELIQNLAVKAFNVLGAGGVCRIDFMVNEETGQVYVNEINTIPGSLAYYLWEKDGMSFTKLMDELVDEALERERIRSRMTFSYDTNLLSDFGKGGVKGVKK